MDNDLVPAPLLSQGARKEPPPRSADRMSPRKNSVAKRSDASLVMERASPALDQELDASTGPRPSTSGSPAVSVAASPAPETPPAEGRQEDDEEEEAHDSDGDKGDENSDQAASDDEEDQEAQLLHNTS